MSLITLLGNSIYKKELAKITRSLFIWESQFIDYKKKGKKKPKAIISDLSKMTSLNKSLSEHLEI